MNKKIFFTTGVCLLFLLTSCGKVSESSKKIETEIETETEIYTTETETETMTEPPTEPPTEITPENRDSFYPLCKSAVFYCAEEDAFLYSEQRNVPVAPASLTKLLTASVALYYIHPDEVFTIGSEQSLVPEGSSLCYISNGQKVKLYDLITGMMLASGNDAAYAVAVSTAKALNPTVQMTDTEAVDYFCGQMNAFAEMIGMTNSHFTTPDGSDNENQYTTANDLLQLAKYALSIPELREIAGTYEKYVVFASGENITWTNSNKLLNPEGDYYCRNAIGMKTGTTLNAGNCLIAAFSKNEKTYISVVTGCASDDDRYRLTKLLFSDFT